MSSDLTLPGTISGLLRRGSPVIKDGWIGGAVVAKIRDLSLVVVSEDGPSWPFAQPASLRLDLTDATGRAHAAWCLALREVPVGYHLDPAAVSWSRAPAQAACGWALHWLARAMSGGGSLTGSWWTGSHGSPVPTDLLADLDPDDPRLLPDGSRWVDAEALRRVVLHVAGVVA